MARPREFEPDIALQSALELFWCRGYEATSVNDLLSHLAINRSSFYATFGSKRELYLQALDRYRGRYAGGLVDLLDDSDPVLPAIKGVLRSLADEALTDKERRGCLAVNAAMEVAPHDSDVSNKVAATMLDVEKSLERALSRAQRSGELTSGRDVRALARFLSATINGLRVTGKATPSRSRLRDVVDTAMEVVR